MINVSISQDGEIVISQETPGERIYMGEHYARMERDENGSSEIVSDDDKADMFKQGWDAAIRESQLQYVNGRIEEFWNEMDPNREEDRVKEREMWAVAREAFDDRDPEDGGPIPVVAEGVARPVTDSGEPEKEADTESFRDHAGRWIMPDEELQTLKDAEFERGMAYTSPTVNRRITDSELDALYSPKRIKFSQLRVVADTLAGEAPQRASAPSLDDLLVRVAESLGFEVTR